MSNHLEQRLPEVLLIFPNKKVLGWIKDVDEKYNLNGFAQKLVEPRVCKLRVHYEVVAVMKRLHGNSESEAELVKKARIWLSQSGNLDELCTETIDNGYKDVIVFAKKAK